MPQVWPGLVHLGKHELQSAGLFSGNCRCSRFYFFRSGTPLLITAKVRFQPLDHVLLFTLANLLLDFVESEVHDIVMMQLLGLHPIGEPQP